MKKPTEPRIPPTSTLRAPKVGGAGVGIPSLNKITRSLLQPSSKIAGSAAPTEATSYVRSRAKKSSCHAVINKVKGQVLANAGQEIHKNFKGSPVENIRAEECKESKAYKVNATSEGGARMPNSNSIETRTSKIRVASYSREVSTCKTANTTNGSVEKNTISRNKSSFLSNYVASPEKNVNHDMNLKTEIHKNLLSRDL